MSKKILVTGSNGLLGQKLTDLYRNKTDKKLFASGPGADRYPHQQGYEYHSLDIKDRNQVFQIIETLKPDVLINTAAMTNVDACELNQKECDELNVQAVKHLSEACKLHNVHLIHLSTDFIFDGTHGPVTEEETPNPLSYYGHSKLKGEEIIKASGCKYAILRTVLVYGIVNDMSRSNIVLWAKQALESGKPINVVDDQFRTPTLAEDLAMGCFLAEDKSAEGIFNISGPDFMSIYELVERVADYYGLSKENLNRSDSNSLNQPAKRPPITGFVLEKAKNELGYEPHTFEQGLELISEQIKNKVSV